MINLHTLKINKKARHKKKRLGRGNSSGHGTYSGRGQKGQRSRSGGRKGLKIKGFKSAFQKIPKFKGFKSRYPKSAVINLGDLQIKFENNEEITPLKLLEKGLLKNLKYPVKILGEGRLSKKFIVRAHGFSKSAQQAIIQAGGKIEIIQNQNKKKNQ